MGGGSLHVLDFGYEFADQVVGRGHRAGIPSAGGLGRELEINFAILRSGTRRHLALGYELLWGLLSRLIDDFKGLLGRWLRGSAEFPPRQAAEAARPEPAQAR